MKRFTFKTLLLGGFCFFCLALGNNFAQDRPNALRLSYGLQHQLRQDQLFSPLVYKGLAIPNLALAYQRFNESSIHQAEIGFSLYNMRNGKEFEYLDWLNLTPKKGLSSSFIDIKLNYTFLKKIFTANDFSIYLGAKSSNEIEAFFYEFGRFSTFGYTGIFSLNPAIQFNYQMPNDDRLFLALDVPVVAWVARSPYAVNDDDFIERQSSHKTLPTLARLMADGKLQTLNQVKNIRLQAAYQRFISERLSLEALYEFNYQYLKQPRPSESIKNNLFLTLSFHF
ncbi:MAG: hypothetical protein MUE85_20725 [Microscillaceae bacterium]|jgi:hypothetical protein|nr:hypothetical protein [Microscillaceae bacterium]